MSLREADSRALDAFRGIAVALMVANHLGYAVVPAAAQQSLPNATLIFLGSVAPALFFFATGQGAGLSPHNGPLRHLLAKMALLLAADALLLAARGKALGLDFFGFTAVCMAALYALKACPRPRQVAVGAVALLLLARYTPAIAPVLGAVLPEPWVIWLTGRGGIAGVSYPLSPWLIYPLAGWLWAQHAPASDRGRVAGLWGVILLSCGLAAVAWWRQAPFFRWGSVSLAYFVLSWAVLAGAWLLSRRALPQRLLSVRGLSSYLNVPVHYFLVGLCTAAGLAWPQPLAYAALLLGVLAASLLASRALEAGFVRADAAAPLPSSAVGLLVLTLAWAGSLAWLLDTPGLGRAAVALAGQLGVALLLVRVARAR